jgi:CDP-diacylglycerol--serine O-phosphatidyltransferase
MDSLADVINFGVAPALVLYAFLLDRAGSPGWIAALLFVIACGMRLARFNVLEEDHDRPAWQGEYFVGVPAPAGAVVVMLPLYLAFLGLEPTRYAAFIGTAFTIIIAFLLVSRLPVYSGKSLKIPGDRMLLVILAVVLYILLLVSYPWYTLTVSVCVYLLFLPFSVRAYSRRAKKEGEAELPPDVDARSTE